MLRSFSTWNFSVLLRYAKKKKLQCECEGQAFKPKVLCTHVFLADSQFVPVIVERIKKSPFLFCMKVLRIILFNERGEKNGHDCTLEHRLSAPNNCDRKFIFFWSLSNQAAIHNSIFSIISIYPFNALHFTPNTCSIKYIPLPACLRSNQQTMIFLLKFNFFETVLRAGTISAI